MDSTLWILPWLIPFMVEPGGQYLSSMTPHHSCWVMTLSKHQTLRVPSSKDNLVVLSYSSIDYNMRITPSYNQLRSISCST